MPGNYVFLQDCVNHHYHYYAENCDNQHCSVEPLDHLLSSLNAVYRMLSEFMRAILAVRTTTAMVVVMMVVMFLYLCFFCHDYLF